MCSGCVVPRTTVTRLQKDIYLYISIIFFCITIKCQFSSMKAVRPTWFAEPTIIHASWCPSQVFVSPRPKHHTIHFWGGSWGLQGQRGPVSWSWSHQTERASASLSKGSLGVRTYHSSFPTVETWHLFQKMPNVFSLHICCHISDLSLVRCLWKKERSKQIFLSLACWVIWDDLTVWALVNLTMDTLISTEQNYCED